MLEESRLDSPGIIDAPPLPLIRPGPQGPREYVSRSHILVPWKMPINLQLQSFDFHVAEYDLKPEVSIGQRLSLFVALFKLLPLFGRRTIH